MNDSHVIDSWIAELGLSSRRVRRLQQRQPDAPAVDAAPARPARPPLPGLRAHPEAARASYRVIPSPC